LGASFLHAAISAEGTRARLSFTPKNHDPEEEVGE